MEWERGGVGEREVKCARGRWSGREVELERVRWTGREGGRAGERDAELERGR